MQVTTICNLDKGNSHCFPMKSFSVGLATGPLPRQSMVNLFLKLQTVPSYLLALCGGTAGNLALGIARGDALEALDPIVVLPAQESSKIAHRLRRPEPAATHGTLWPVVEPTGEADDMRLARPAELEGGYAFGDDTDIGVDAAVVWHDLEAAASLEVGVWAEGHPSDEVCGNGASVKLARSCWPRLFTGASFAFRTKTECRALFRCALMSRSAWACKSRSRWLSG